MSRNLLTAVLLISLVACNQKWASSNIHSAKINKEKHEKDAHEDRSEAAEAMDYWSMTRSFPDGIFHAENLEAAFQQRATQLAKETDYDFPNWRSLGPANVAGRTLCLAFHPTDSMTMWAGSASGGLWKTTSGGLGTNAWSRVTTGFPVLGVASIAVSADAKTLYLGTGEVYGSPNTGGGFGLRLQRGSYGIGILKSTDGGVTWSKSMDWTQNNMRGVQKIVLNPSRQNTVFAATTEGTYRSYDAGKNWTLVNAIPMAVDLEIAPNDTNRMYCTHGSLFNAQNGIFRSLDGGTTWTKLTVGLPMNYTGKTHLTVVPSEPNTLYASVANAESQIGLFKSINGGDSWTMLNDDNVALYQGWYSHDVAVCPTNPNCVIHVGIDAHFSANAGVNFSKISNWYTMPFGRSPDVTGNYIHADIHAVYFSPFNPNKTYFVGDGGIYKNDNFQPLIQGQELSFQQINNGLQTSQFYANFSNSQQDSVFAIGGMQDNWTAIYDGQANWIRVIGGDGMCTAIHPQNDNIVFGSYQYLNLARSEDRGQQFWGINMGGNGGSAVFNGPFEFAPSNPSVMYAGAERILRSNDTGLNFLDGAFLVDSSNSINTIAVNPKRENSLLVATFPTVRNTAKILKSTDGGNTVSLVLGLPNRVFTDIAFAPNDTNVVLATVSGFGTEHVYKSSDGGFSWQPFGAGLPDIPTNTVVFDPIYPNFVYVGNDLGVYFSTNAGLTWGPLSNSGLPEACIVMHLSLSPKNRKLRAATHGNGVYEMDILTPQNLRQAMQTLFTSTNLEGTNMPIRTNYFLKKTRQGDTLDYLLSAANNARLTIPTGLPPSPTAVPDYPFPHPLAVPFNDSTFIYKITPTRTIDLRDGVTTYDIALVSRLILGIETSLLTSPLKLLAADVNGDGAIDGVDLLLLRRFVLYIDERFSEVPQWVFVPKTFTMPSVPPRLSAIPQSYFFNPYATRNPNPFAFWTVKMGDVNNSYTPTDALRNPQNSGVELRSNPVVLTTEDIFMEAGNVYDIKLKTSKSTTCMGLQGTINLKKGVYTEGSSFLNVESVALKNFGEANIYDRKNGQVTFSWNETANQIFEKNTPILTLRIKATQSGQLSEVLQLNSDITTASIFDEQGRDNPLTLNFEKSKTPDFTAEAKPNPFSEVVEVKIGTYTEGSLRYTIFDASGKEIFHNQIVVKKGDTTLKLNSAENNLTNSGIYFLKIETKSGSRTIKLSRL
jgi:photosystem II stability/assembly factor-like uncharacterized protein